jgi:hypothetical protein
MRPGAFAPVVRLPTPTEAPTAFGRSLSAHSLFYFDDKINYIAGHTPLIRVNYCNHRQRIA